MLRVSQVSGWGYSTHTHLIVEGDRAQQGSYWAQDSRDLGVSESYMLLPSMRTHISPPDGMEAYDPLLLGVFYLKN